MSTHLRYGPDIDYRPSLTATNVLSSNLLVWLEARYFAAGLEAKPLLLTWLLGADELEQMAVLRMGIDSKLLMDGEGSAR